MLIVRRVPRQRTRASAALTTLESVTALALAHAAAGGDLPQVGWLLPPALAAYGASRVVLSRRASIRVMLPALVAVQLFLHAWLVVLAPGTHAGHAAHAGDHPPADLLGMTGPMLWAHVAAGAVTALAWSLRSRAIDVLVAWSDPGPLPTPRLRAAPTARTPRPHPRGVLLSIAPTRGPPARQVSAA